MSIEDSYYNNVFLLMQIVPASAECAKHFRKGMFTKSNTLGFIHISHYLLSVYNANRFRSMVHWPIMDKTDEKQYRTEIKEYLEIVRNENPDIIFPTILMSYLLQASGIKILTIMWKISEISIRTYIAREYKMTLLFAPKQMTNINNITESYLTYINVKRNIAISELSEKVKSDLESFKDYMKIQSTELKEIQTCIFETKYNIDKIIHEAPVHCSARKRLANIEDSEIIKLWKMDIEHKIKFLCEINAKIKKISMMSDSIHNLISNLCSTTGNLDGNKLPNVDNERVVSFFNNIMQDSHKLYRNNCLVLHVLFLMFNEILKRMHCCLKLDDLIDVVGYEPKIKGCCETIKSMEKMFCSHIEEIANISRSIRLGLQKHSLINRVQTDFNGTMSHEVSSPSTVFNFADSNQKSIERLFENLYFSPVKGKYKHLFKRHERNHLNLPEIPVFKYQCNDSINSTSIWKSPQRQFTRGTFSPNRVPVSPMYKQLFPSNQFKRNSFRDNIVVSTPKPIETNETLDESSGSSIGTPLMQTMNIEAAMKNILDLSSKITHVATSLCKSDLKNTMLD